MTLSQINRHAEIITPLGTDVLLFYRMSAIEELGRPYKLKLDLLSKAPDINFEEILGKNVTIRLNLPLNQKRYFNGYVSQFRQTTTPTEINTILDIGGDDLSAYSATVHPWLWFLTRTADCRIFQGQSVPEIVKAVFRDNGFTDFEESFSGGYRNLEYCVQYRETDFNFVSRLMEQEGIYYYFRHEEEKHILVLSDSIRSHAPFPGYEKLPYSARKKESAAGKEQVYQWKIGKHIQPGIYALNDFDFTRPKMNLLVKSSISRDHAYGDMEYFDYPGVYPDTGDGENYARVRLEALQSEYEQAQGQSNARGLSAGSLFQLYGYPRDDQNREYLIVKVIHKVVSDRYTPGEDTDSAQPYTAVFTAIPSDAPFRPARITSKPVVKGPQTAIVVGPPGEEIHTDAYGRVKIQFHWDRYSNSDPNSSCWVRVSHPNAGKGYGSVSVPRVGQEVIVDFLEGDPDQPIITGRVYNANQMPAYGFPAAAMVSGTKSNSTPGGGGYNEMSMNDTKGQEQMTLHAQKDMNTTVGNNQSLAVKNNRSVTVDADDSTSVKGNQAIGVDGDQQLTIKGKQEKTIEGDKSVTVKGNGSETVNGNRQVKITGNNEQTFEGDHTTNIVGSRNKTINGPEVVTINSSRTKTISDGETVTINGTTLHTINADFTRRTTGTYLIDAPDINNVGTQKVTFTCAGSSMTLTSEKIIITSGGSTIEIGVSGVSINGKKISLN